MANKKESSKGLYILTFFTFINFAALVCITVYHIQYERQDNGLTTISGKDVFKQILNDLEQELSPRKQRHADLYPQIPEYLRTQKSSVIEECKREVANMLIESGNTIEPEEGVREKRQTSSTGNDLASIFGEIAKTEVGILAKYCNNGSFVCMPGQKGEPGSLGLTGLQGTQGPQGPQGLMGPQGLEGPSGYNGTQGVQGYNGSTGPTGPKGDPGNAGAVGPKGDKGDKGDVGANGASVTGPAGRKGDKGEQGDRALPPKTQCCSSLSVPSFKQQVETIRVLEGKDVTLRCDGTGYPLPTIDWNPSLFAMDKSRTTVSPSVVTIKNVKSSDGQVYTCTAHNAIGNSVKQMIVNVYTPCFDAMGSRHCSKTGICTDPFAQHYDCQKSCGGCGKGWIG